MAPLCALLLLGALAWRVASNQAFAVAMEDGMASPWQVGARAQQPTLVIYVYSATDPEYGNNLRFFIKHGIAAGDGVDYIIVIQRMTDEPQLDVLPKLPRNARLIYRMNSCYDWGTVGWVLRTQGIDTAKYKYFLFMNSSARGPFLPSYWPNTVHWTQPLVSRLRGLVKLVGPTISCEGEPLDGNPQNVWKTNPHVQSYVVATDQVGLGILTRDHRVFACHANLHAAIYHAELGSSAAILRAGYSIDTLMTRYQGVDWRIKSNWHCNQRINPYGEFYNDGISLNPYEVMFVKVKAHQLELGWSAVRAAHKYTLWLEGAAMQGISDNEYVPKREFLTRPMTLAMGDQGAACFDSTYYMQRNQDLPEAIALVPEGLWDHFVMYGQHEGRPHQFLCGERQQLALERQEASKRAAMSLLRTQMPCSPLFGAKTGGPFAPSCNTTVA